MKDIYDKLEVPPASADFESRIIAAANVHRKKHFLHRLAAVAVCLVIIFSVLTPEQKPLVTKKNMLSDVEFFDEQYGFDADIS